MKTMPDNLSGTSIIQSKEKLKAVVSALPDLIFIIDEDGRHLEIMTSEENSLYKNVMEIKDKLLKEIFPPDIAESFLNVVLKTLNEDKPQSIEYELEILGELKCYEARTSPLREIFNDKRCIVWVARDITMRKRTEQHAIENHERLQSISNAIPDIIFVVDSEGYYVEVIAPKENLLYKSADLLIGKNFYEVFPSETAGKFLEVISRTINENQTLILEYDLNVPAGKKWFEGRTAKLNLTLDGKDLAVFIARDITDRKSAEQKLKESEERFRLLYNKTPVMMKATDIHANILTANDHYLNMLGYSRNEIIGRKSIEFLTEESRIAVQKALDPELLKDGEIRSTECRLIKKDGGLIDAEVYSSAELDEHGEILQILSFFVDISDRKRAENLANENIYLTEKLKVEGNYGDIIGDSKSMQEVYSQISKVAATGSTVLLLGETGSGKELIARAIHNFSSRKEKVLVNVNCGALPPGLVESELFGHEKGAFTGATNEKKGKFEMADGGTIFLDEIGEVSLETQVKLLRVLQEHEFEKVGGNRVQKVNVRVIAATNRNLAEEVKKGAFRADLYFRLNIFPISIPPLRDRIDDIPLLTNYFITKFARCVGKRISGISNSALAKLQNYSWPGNIRELANILERAVILCEGRIIQDEHIGRLNNLFSEVNSEMLTLDEMEKQHILKALDISGGALSGRNGAAEILGINRSTLWSRMKKLGIKITRNTES